MYNYIYTHEKNKQTKKKLIHHIVHQYAANIVSWGCNGANRMCEWLGWMKGRSTSTGNHGFDHAIMEVHNMFFLNEERSMVFFK